jgi:hypothetical protein
MLRQHLVKHHIISETRSLLLTAAAKQNLNRVSQPELIRSVIYLRVFEVVSRKNYRVVEVGDVVVV